MQPRSNLALPALAAFAAAAAGGVAWGLILKWTQYEVGFVAWGIGFLAATAAVTVAGKRSSTALQVIAVVATLAGIVLGKYLGYALWGKDNGYDFQGMWGWFDLLWVGLGVVTAWRIAQPEDELTPAEPEPVEAREP
jgi:steroid 5-alpha reductase family enzyme